MSRGAIPPGALAALVLLLLACLMTSSSGPGLSPAAPTVLLSVDRGRWQRLAVSRLTYDRALRRAGARVRRIDASALAIGGDPPATAERLLAGADALVLAGGGDVDPTLFGGRPEIGRGVDPDRDRLELALLARARELRLPVLAICRGAQLLNVARGGTLRTLRRDPALRSRHRRWRGHPVEIDPGSRLAGILGAERLRRVVSWHGQAVERPGRGLRVVAHAADGVVEAFEGAAGERWMVAVQWHPEWSPQSRRQRRLFAALVAAAGGG